MKSFSVYRILRHHYSVKPRLSKPAHEELVCHRSVGIEPGIYEEF